MECEEVGKHVAGRLKGELSDAARAELAEHLQTCAACRAEAEGVDDLWTKLGGVFSAPLDEAGAQARFDKMLDAYQREARVPHAGGRRWARGPHFDGWQAAAAVVLLVAGGVSGAAVARRQTAPPPAELGELRRELHEVREMLTLSLMQQESATERLRGVSWSHQIDQPGSEIVRALLDTLLHDQNVNVRLAAVDALRRFSGQEAVHKGTVAALSDSSAPLVQIALIDFVVETKETDAADTLRKLSMDAMANEAVRERAVWGLQQLRL